jgi:hypothetical protein
MLASFPASMLNQKPSDLGILNRFKLDPSRSSRVEEDLIDQLFRSIPINRHRYRASACLKCATSRPSEVKKAANCTYCSSGSIFRRLLLRSFSLKFLIGINGSDAF